MPVFTLSDGGQLNYHLTGSDRPPLLLLHGWTAYHAVWFAQRRFFRGEYNVITPDFRGHGKSSHERGLSVHRFANDIHELLQSLRLADVSIIGHSMGALVLLDYLQTFGPDGINKIVLVDQSPRLLTDANWRLGIYGDFTEETNQRFIQGLAYNFPTTMINFSQHGLKDNLITFADQYNGPLMTRDYMIPEIMIDIWNSIVHSDYRSMLPTISIPTLLVYGGLSQFYSRETGQYMHRQIHGSILTYIEDAQHSPPLEQPDHFNQVVRKFFRTT